MPHQSRSSDSVNLENVAVLLIDDNPQALEILSSVVQGFGVREQIHCSSAIEASQVMKNRQVDLILLDCAMPEMDGYDFVRWLRRETPKPARQTPIIMLTGHAISTQISKSRDCGVNFIVTKPLTPAVLMHRILWLATNEREFIDCDTYAGPDRRV